MHQSAQACEWHVSGRLLMWGSARLPCAFGQLGVGILLALTLLSSALQL